MRAVLVDAEDLVVLVVGDGEGAFDDGVRGPVPLDLDVGVDVEVAGGRVGRVARLAMVRRMGEPLVEAAKLMMQAAAGGAHAAVAFSLMTASRRVQSVETAVMQVLPVPRGAMSSLRFTVKVTALAIPGRITTQSAVAARNASIEIVDRRSADAELFIFSPDRPRWLSGIGLSAARVSRGQRGGVGRRTSSGRPAQGVGWGLRVSASAPATRVGSGDHQGASRPHRPTTVNKTLCRNGP